MWIDTLLAEGAISDEQLQDACALAERRGISLERALIEWQYVTWEQIAPLKAADNGLPYLAATESRKSARVPNTCPLCCSELNGSEIVCVGLWDGVIEDTGEGVSGPVCECRCASCGALLTTLACDDVPHAEWTWDFDPEG